MATTRSIRAKPVPGEELIGTVTGRGIRLTREAWRAQLAYRSEQQLRQKVPRRRGLLSWLPRAGPASWMDTAWWGWRGRPAGEPRGHRRTRNAS